MMENLKIEQKTGERRQGQALMELAIFGSIFFVILTAIVTYGLRYSYHQQAQMTAFRRAMAIASDDDYGTGSYMLVQQRHIPNFQDPFGFGSGSPFTASASVTRDYRMGERAVTVDSLPSTVVDIETSNNGIMQPVLHQVMRNAAFREEHSLPDADNDPNAERPLLIQKYDMILGTMADLDSGNYRIIDSCSGQSFDYDSCYQQALEIVDEAACTRHCQRIGGADCTNLCATVMNPPNQTNENGRNIDPSRGGAWYAIGYIKPGEAGNVTGTEYRFPALEEVFRRVNDDLCVQHCQVAVGAANCSTVCASHAAPNLADPAGAWYAEHSQIKNGQYEFAGGAKSLGTQLQASISQTTRNTRMHTAETPTRIVTEEHADWTDNTISRMAILDNVNGATGYQIRDNPMAVAGTVIFSNVEKPVTATVDQTATTPK